MMTRPNYRADRNPFSMSAPPAWWLDGLRNFDPELVVMPSREQIGVFWLTRKVSRLAMLSDQAITHSAVQDQVKAHLTDTAMFLTNRVEPVTKIVTPMGVWALHKVLKWLTEHDTWAVEGGPLDAQGMRNAIANGGSRFTKQVEANDAAALAKRKREQRENIFHATGDGWRSLQARTGQRIMNPGQASRPALSGV